MWLSQDGTTWSQIEHPVFDGLPLRDLLVDDDRLLAVGEGADGSEAVVLLSGDGSQWEVAGRFGNDDFGTVPFAISRSESILVVIADIVGNDVEFYESFDASSWTVSEPTAAFDDGENGRDIACSERICVGVGFHDATYRDEIDANTGAAWVSTTGTSYQLVDHDFDSEALEAVAWANHGFLAVGNTSTKSGVAWISEDGEAWTRLTGSFNQMSITGVTATPDRYMIFGYNPETSGLLVWTSKTGDDWSEEIISDELAEGSQLRTIVDHNGTRIATAIASDTLDTFIWTSTNNQPWQLTATLHTSH